MTKSKICKSCSGPLSEFKKEELRHPEYCPYCVNEKGKLRSYRDILDGMIAYIKDEHEEIKNDKQMETAQKWLSEGPAWEGKFAEKDVVIDDVREENFDDIPRTSDKFECKSCVWYQERKPDTAKEKLKWFLEMEKKYGSCGKILYLNGNPIGWTQFAPKKEFPKLEYSSKGSTKEDVWFISCVTFKKKYRNREYEEMLIKNIIKDLKKRNVKKLQCQGRKAEYKKPISGGLWKRYEKFGFKKIGKCKGGFIGEMKL